MSAHLAHAFELARCGPSRAMSRWLKILETNGLSVIVAFLALSRIGGGAHGAVRSILHVTFGCGCGFAVSDSVVYIRSGFQFLCDNDTCSGNMHASRPLDGETSTIRRQRIGKPGTQLGTCRDVYG